MKTNRLWQICYYLLLAVDTVVVFLFMTASSCFGQTNLRCEDFNVPGVLMLTGLAAVITFLVRRKYMQTSSSGKRRLSAAKGRSPPFSWQGDRTFSAHFIPFFIFGAVFLGEHLPVIIGFLVGQYGMPGSKPSMLDVGGISDILVVYVIYSVFGTLLWLLFRYFSWPVVFAGGSLMGWLGEKFLFVQWESEAGGADIVRNPLGALASLITAWGLISLVPYFAYQAIGRHWGDHGKRIAVFAVFALNIAGFAFFAYEKYVLENVYRVPDTLPSGICPERYVEEAGKPSLAYWATRTYTVSHEEGERIKSDCPWVVERIGPANP